jgi:hypothetical protein
MVSGYQLQGLSHRRHILILLPVTPTRYVVDMESITLTRTTKTDHLMAMSNSKLEAWFDTGGLAVEVVANCSDPACPDCMTLVPAQEAA